MPEIFGRRVVQKFRGSDQYFTDTTHYTYYPIKATDTGTEMSMGIWIDPTAPTVGHLVGWIRPVTWSDTPYTIGTIIAPSGVTFSADKIKTTEAHGYINITGTTVAVHANGTYNTNSFSVYPDDEGSTEMTVTVTQS